MSSMVFRHLYFFRRHLIPKTKFHKLSKKLEGTAPKDIVGLLLCIKNIPGRTIIKNSPVSFQQPGNGN